MDGEAMSEKEKLRERGRYYMSKRAREWLREREGEVKGRRGFARERLGEGEATRVR